MLQRHYFIGALLHKTPATIISASNLRVDPFNLSSDVAGIRSVVTQLNTCHKSHTITYPPLGVGGGGGGWGGWGGFSIGGTRQC